MNRIAKLAFACVVLAVAVAASACGGAGSSAGSSAAGAGTSASGSNASSGGGYGYGRPSKAAAGSDTIMTAKSDLGTILVDGDGKTLYLFEADKGTTSVCSGGCVAVWPPVTTEGNPRAGAGVQSQLLGTTMRSDGTTEVTYGGHPLYWYSGDVNPGDTNGEGLTDFGGSWDAVSPAGDSVEPGS
jgi:predicted lipoprotein with Yx(FWY)xxD motif